MTRTGWQGWPTGVRVANDAVWRAEQVALVVIGGPQEDAVVTDYLAFEAGLADDDFIVVEKAFDPGRRGGSGDLSGLTKHDLVTGFFQEPRFLAPDCCRVLSTVTLSSLRKPRRLDGGAAIQDLHRMRSCPSEATLQPASLSWACQTGDSSEIRTTQCAGKRTVTVMPRPA